MGRWLLRLLAFALAAALTVLVIIPVAVDQYRRYEDARIIDRYQAALEETGAEALNALLAQCRSYNRRHRSAALKDVFSQVVEDSQQASLLERIQAVGSDEVLGVLDIPKIGVILPIYPSSDGHATRNGAAFVEGTSLPAGGESAHTVLAANRNWLMGRQFRRLDRLRLGDLFAISVLGESITFEVDSIQIVDPEEMDATLIVDDVYCTLMARGPEWNGSQRLLVRGKYTRDRLTAANDDTGYLPELSVVLILGAPVAALLLVWLLLTGLIARGYELWRLWRVSRRRRF